MLFFLKPLNLVFVSGGRRKRARPGVLQQRKINLFGACNRLRRGVASKMGMWRAFCKYV